MTENIIILGRGISLKRIPELKNIENIEYVILLNTFWDSPQSETPYYKNEIIHNLLSKKKIILIFNHLCNIDKLDIFCEKYNIISIYITLFPKKTRIGIITLKKIILKYGNIYPYNSIQLLPEELIPKFLNNEKNFTNVGTMGLVIEFINISLKYKNIYIFGLDFYEKNYLFKQNHDYNIECNKSELIKNDFLFFFKNLKHLNFHIYSLANIKEFIENNNFSIPNLTIL